jgi:hypothetical protein
MKVERKESVLISLAAMDIASSVIIASTNTRAPKGGARGMEVPLLF